MAMGKRRTEQQGSIWIAADEVAKGPGHPFYRRLNSVLEKAGFDAFVEERCRRFYAEGVGRPGIPPGVYFRMLMIGYFEGIDSERGIAWRVADSLGLREFLGIAITDRTPDHSSLSVIRGRLSPEVFQEVFDWALKRLAEAGLVRGRTIGIDATTLEASAAMRSIVRRDTHESYQEYLVRLAVAAGIQEPTRDDVARLDRKRKGKASNEDWFNPNDPDARITKMKDGRTHLAHKAEHAVDLDTGATLAVTVQPADRGDTQSLGDTLCETIENVDACVDRTVEELVADRGYHSNDVVADLAEMEIRSYISEPKRGRRRWKGKDRERRAVHANRRRIRGVRGRALLRRRGEYLERPFAHHYDTGGMRRTHLKGHAKILKRLLVHSAANNLALLMRTLIGIGKPRRLEEAGRAVREAICGLVHAALGVGRAILTILAAQERRLGAPALART